MDEECKTVLFLIGFKFEILNDLDGLLIPREQLLDDKKYDEINLHFLKWLTTRGGHRHMRIGRMLNFD